jgi:hypothetical protein
MADRKKHKYQVEKLLALPDKGISQTRGIGGILARLWRETWQGLNMSPSRFESLLTDYITSANKKLPDDRVTLHLTRGNMRRELEKDTMTFKVFIKAMKFLKVQCLKVIVVLEHATGRKTSHQLDIDLKVSVLRGSTLLAKLWGEVQKDLNVTNDTNRFEQLLTDFIVNAKQGIPESRLSRHLTRGNMRRELEKDMMTFKVFIKAMKLLKVRNFKIIVELDHLTGETTAHHTAVDLGETHLAGEAYSAELEDTEPFTEELL